MALADTLSIQGLPANVVAERSVLGAILLDAINYHQIASLLQPDDFHLDTHRKIYRAIRELAQTNTAIDYITLGDALERTHDLEAIGGHAYLTSLTEGLPRGINVEHYAAIIKDRAVLRECLAGSNEVSQSVLAGETSTEVLALAQRKFL